MTLKQVGAYSTVIFTVVAAMLLATLVLGFSTKQPADAQGSCPAQDTSRGVVTSTFDVPNSGSYSVWARMSAQSATNDSFLLELDSTTCGIVMGDTAVPTSGWKWVNYRNGSTTNKVTVSLTSGTHTMKLIGREDGVKVDRVLFIPSASSCVPDDTSKGDNCMISVDTEPPKTSMTSPTAGQTIGGTFNLQATASDDTGVSKVEFYVGDTLVATDTTSPYAHQFDTKDSRFTNATYNFTSLAYDATGNKTRSQNVSATIYNQPVDNTPPSVTMTAPLNNSTISGENVSVSASASDASGIARVEFLVDGQVRNNDTTAPYTFFLDSRDLSKGAHTITARAYDNVGLSKTAGVTVNVDNTVTTKKCDFTGDNVVGLGDLSRLLSNYGRTVSPNSDGDCTGDGQVGLADLSTLLSGYGK